MGALASWNDTATKGSIEKFVTGATTPGDSFLDQADRIAILDNDGIFWIEQPCRCSSTSSSERSQARCNRTRAWPRRTDPYKHNGDHHMAHVTSGQARRPPDARSEALRHVHVPPAVFAVYHLGNNGTAPVQLHEYKVS